MKKKILSITLVDGRVLKRDVTQQQNAPFGAGANDQYYASLCQAICVGGTTDTDTIISKDTYTHIAPSQIKYVTIDFSD